MRIRLIEKKSLIEENALNDPDVQETIEQLPEEEQTIVDKILDRIDFTPIDNPNVGPLMEMMGKSKLLVRLLMSF